MPQNYNPQVFTGVMSQNHSSAFMFSEQPDKFKGMFSNMRVIAESYSRDCERNIFDKESDIKYLTGLLEKYTKPAEQQEINEVIGHAQKDLLATRGLFEKAEALVIVMRDIPDNINFFSLLMGAYGGYNNEQ